MVVGESPLAEFLGRGLRWRRWQRIQPGFDDGIARGRRPGRRGPEVDPPHRGRGRRGLGGCCWCWRSWDVSWLGADVQHVEVLPGRVRFMVWSCLREASSLQGRGRASLQLGGLVGGCSRGWSLGQRNGAQPAVSTGRNAADVHRVPDLGGLSAETSGLAAAERVHNGTQQGPQAASVDLFTWGGRVETGNKGWKEARAVPGAGRGTEALSRNGADESLGTRKTAPPLSPSGELLLAQNPKHFHGSPLFEHFAPLERASCPSQVRISRASSRSS